MLSAPTIRAMKSQSYHSSPPYGNFTMYCLDYKNGKLYMSYHNSGNGGVAIIDDPSISPKISTTWGTTGYTNSIAVYNGRLYQTDYSSNNAILRSYPLTSDGQLQSLNSTSHGNGFGYGGIPILEYGGALYGAYPNTGTTYSFNTFKGVNVRLGTSTKSKSISFSGLTGGFIDVSSDGEFFFVVDNVTYKHDSSFSIANATLKAFDSAGSLVSTRNFTLPAGTMPGGVAYNPDRKSVYVLAVRGANNQPVHSVLEFPASTNTSPTQPGGITGIASGAVYLTGENIILSWAGSTDPEGDAITYDIEFTSDGSTWVGAFTNLATTSQKMYFRNTDSDSCQLRVRAKDSKGGYSEYVVSPVFKTRKMLLLIKDSDSIKTYKNGSWQPV